LTALADMALPGEQRRLNQEAKAFTVEALADAGYPPVESQANFVMVDVRRDIRAFQDACRQRGVGVARPFPPLLTYARITIGTMDEMRRAVPAIREVLSQPATTASLGPHAATPWIGRPGPREC